MHQPKKLQFKQVRMLVAIDLHIISHGYIILCQFHFMPTSSDLSFLMNSTIMAMSTRTIGTQTDCSSFAMRTQETWTVDAEWELNSTLISINCDHDYLGNIDLDSVDSTTSDNIMDTSFFIPTSGTEESTDDESHRPESDTPSTEKKYLVFESCLERLFHFCPICHQHVTETVMETTRGSEGSRVQDCHGSD